MPYWFALYLWSLAFQPHYQPPPTRPPVYWTQTMPLAQTPAVIVMPPCRSLGPNLSVCS